MNLNNKKVRIINCDINPISLKSLCEKITEWIKEKKGHYICVSAVHACIETYNKKEFANAHNNADIAVPDGRPLFWALKLLGYKNAEWLPGYFVLRNICKLAEINNFEIGFYGGKKNSVEKCMNNLKDNYKNLKINYSYSPPSPFINLLQKKDYKLINDINSSQTKILFVALGCPVQELWMASHKNDLNCVCIGVGAAIDFISGYKLLAPKWVQKMGLLWLVRLISEPRRLFWRYLSTNLKFIYLFSKQYFEFKFK